MNIKECNIYTSCKKENIPHTNVMIEEINDNENI